MKTDYTFSYYTKTNVVTIKHYKWWQVWKKSELVNTITWVRKSKCINLNDYEIAELNAGINDKESLLFKMTFTEWNESICNKANDSSHQIKMFQLETTTAATEYIISEVIKK